MTTRYILGMDIGGTNVRCGLVDRHAAISHFELTPSEDIFCHEGHQLMHGLSQYILSYCARNLGADLPLAVSIGFPSTLNREKTVLLSTPNLPFPDNVPVVHLLQEALPMPVFINRDVNMLMLYDMQHQHVPKDGIVLGCYFGTGLGNAIWMRGEILSGKNGVAGELGHIPVLGADGICGCGNVGCMETLAGGRHLSEIREKYFPGCPMDKLFTLHGNTKELEQFVELMSLPIATEVNIFDPDCVILGGGILQMPDFPIRLLKKQIDRHARKPYPSHGLNIVLSRPSQESGVIGAGIYGMSQQLNEVKEA